ncbi:MAG: hypothetical protein AAF432_10805, partial [Planctomycetota bacterium]
RGFVSKPIHYGSYRAAVSTRVTSHGWPFVTSRYFAWRDGMKVNPQWTMQVAGGYIFEQPPAPPAKPWQFPPPRVLPTTPIWSGIIINSLFYAVVAFIIVRTPFWIRHLIRARRNRCTQCGYPRGESSVCSECGHGAEVVTA